MACRAAAAGWQTTIEPGDRALTQLTTDQTTVQVTVMRVKALAATTPEHVMQCLGILPTQIIALCGLMGALSDNYPGVTCVGEKTALKLLCQTGSIENLTANIAAMCTSKMCENLIKAMHMPTQRCQLATIARDAPEPIDLADVCYNGPDLACYCDF